MWLLVEPLSTFQLGSSLMASLGVGGYLGLLLFSGIATVGDELFQKRKLIGKMDLIPINVTLTETGTKYYLNTPRDLKTGIFIKRFIDSLPNVPQDSMLFHSDMFDLSLIVITSQSKIELDPTLSFSDADIPLDKELECRIKGKIKQEFLVAYGMMIVRSRPVDVVICLDVTGSMQGVIDDIKTNLVDLYQSVVGGYQNLGITIDDVRVRIIAFRDYYHDGAQAIEMSPYYYLPNDRKLYENIMTSLQAKGGGDTPESSLEALAIGIMSDWKSSGGENQLVVLITDSPPHPLEMNANSKPENYPEGIPLSMDDLRSLWESGSYIKNSGKKLLLIAPEYPEWISIRETWSMVYHVDFGKVDMNQGGISGYISQLVSESMIDAERVA